MSNRISSLVDAYLEYKHGLGFRLVGETVYLKAFARYTIETGYNGSLTRQIVFQWCELGENPSLVTKGRRYEPIKSFADYANAFDPESEIMPKLPYGNPHKRIRPHIYSLEETCSLMECCDKLYDPDGIRSLMHIAASNGRFCGAKRPQCEADRPQAVAFVSRILS